MGSPEEPALPPDAAALAVQLLSLCRDHVVEHGAAWTNMALAYVAGELLGATAADERHLVELLSNFADMTADHAEGRLHSLQPPRASH